jgi:hypothetical protein
MGERQAWLFEPTFNRSVKLRQADHRISDNAGALLLREIDHPDDIRLTALHMDLLCVGSSTYQDHVVKGPDGRTWPHHPDLDVTNPLGLEIVPKTHAKLSEREERSR